MTSIILRTNQEEAAGLEERSSVGGVPRRSAGPPAVSSDNCEAVSRKSRPGIGRERFCPLEVRDRTRKGRSPSVGWRTVPFGTSVDAETLDAVIGLFEAQLREHKITTSRDDLRAVAQTIIGDKRRGFMLVARVPDGGVIGVAYASFWLSLEYGGTSGWIEELYVSPQWRGRGIGSRLLAEVVARAQESGWRALDLEVEASHLRAISLYARHQFQPHSRSRFYRIL